MPVTRLRRMRKNAYVKDLVRETCLRPENIVMPYFAAEGKSIKSEIGAMPGIFRFSVDNLLKDISGSPRMKTVLIFGVPREKNALASGAYDAGGVVQTAVRSVKKEFPHLVVMTDVCLCSYTTDGHCGITANGKVDNDASLEVLAKAAVSHADAGADFVAPSSMMDAQVGAIRGALDARGFTETGIMAYSAKYASNFYGPFREALDSSPSFGDRKSYQMDYRNSGEAMREIKMDIDEGADIVMVKPALTYLDVIYRAKEKFNVPLAGYNVSGEYSMVKSLALGDTGAERELALEVTTSIKRAGADLIITYFGKQMLEWMC